PERPSLLRRIIAVILAFLGAGLGHVILGHPLKAAKWFVGVNLAVAGFVFAVIAGQRHLAWLFLASGVTIQLAAIVDVVRLRTAPVVGKLKLILFAVLLIAGGKVSGDAVQRFVRAEHLVAASMYPTIDEGDYIVTSRFVPKLNRGDLIVF